MAQNARRDRDRRLLRSLGLRMYENDAGNPTRQRWAITHGGTVTVDFLIQPSRDEEPLLSRVDRNPHL